ncbi:hypothetical protein CEXT_662491 [Caerostris extrusa]|uniref:Uncharacterized protein n=1 Tax=Caerostris extrusa TaxID=172846 RepID=A0AAV4VE58_CAEEX|nr:hypothetical protein CEXT_662491 [Caerostris extrusa]
MRPPESERSDSSFKLHLERADRASEGRYGASCGDRKLLVQVCDGRSELTKEDCTSWTTALDITFLKLICVFQVPTC